MKDIDIARAATLLPIQEVAATLGIGADQLIPYGRAKAKLDLAAMVAPFVRVCVATSAPSGS